MTLQNPGAFKQVSCVFGVLMLNGRNKVDIYFPSLIF